MTDVSQDSVLISGALPCCSYEIEGIVYQAQTLIEHSYLTNCFSEGRFATGIGKTFEAETFREDGHNTQISKKPQGPLEKLSESHEINHVIDVDPELQEEVAKVPNASRTITC